MNKLLPLVLLGYALPAEAYLDPSSGSMLVASLVGIIATLFFVVKSICYKFLSLVGRKKSHTKHTYGTVFYAEGSHYWPTFKPLIDSLNALQHSVTYFTSDEEDVAFGFSSDMLSVNYIGQGNQAYARLNFLNADICVLTTPGLDVLQIKRSKGVGHYVHVVHSAMDVHTYKLYSFDYFDVVLCSGQHQIDSLKLLESKRNTDNKQLLLTGCLYFDELMRKKCQLPAHTAIPVRRRVLIAPTWGVNGLLTRFGMAILVPLLERDFEVTVRPHPQSYIVEQEMLTELQTALHVYKNIKWDSEPDNFDSLSQADLMVSDISGIMFDYSFLFEKPVISIEFEPNWLGTECFDMDTRAFELTVLDRIGRQIGPDEIPSLPDIAQEILNTQKTASQIESLRETMTVNFGHAGQVAATQILALARAQ